MKPLSTTFYYWVSNSFIPAGSLANWCSNFLIIHHIDFCISSYFGVGDPQYSTNFQENLKVFDNGVPNSMIHLSHLTHQISSFKSKITAFIVLGNVVFKQLLWLIFIFFEDPLPLYLSLRITVPCICTNISWMFFFYCNVGIFLIQGFLRQLLWLI